MRFKGGEFTNRYRITGTLTTQSPLHIGSGEVTTEPISEKERKPGGKTEKEITRIISDCNERPIIPGSAIKGSMSHWLKSLLKSVNPVSNLIGDQEKIKDLNKELEKMTSEDFTAKKHLNKLKEYLGYFDYLFGTIHSEGKLEFWDAACCIDKPMQSNPQKLLHWDPKRLIYRQISVAINPATGTAGEHLLYDFEVVPIGLSFDLNICGQNIDDVELGILLLGLYGFNSQIHPLTLGAMGARGYGRFHFELKKIYRLEKDGIETWIKNALVNNDAGYNSIPELSENDKNKCIQKAKDEIVKILNGGQKS